MNILQTLKKISRVAKSIGAKVLNAFKNNFFVRHFKKILFAIVIGFAILFFIRWIIVGVITKLILTGLASLFPPDFSLSEFVQTSIEQLKNFLSNLF